MKNIKINIENEEFPYFLSDIFITYLLFFSILGYRKSAKLQLKESLS